MVFGDRIGEAIVNNGSKIDRRQFMTIASGLWASALLPNVFNSGKSRSGERVLNELTCIARIKSLHSYVHVCGETEIHAQCRAVDFCLGTFDLRLHFHPATCPIRSNKIIEDLKIDSIFLVRGEWGIAEDDIPMTIYDPEYRLYEPQDLSEQSISELEYLLADGVTWQEFIKNLPDG